MGSNVLFFAWNRSLPGRERLSGEHFQEFAGYLEGLQKNHKIQSYEPVFLDIHGGDLNGFFLIRGETAQLDALMSSAEWSAHMVRAIHHLQNPGTVRGYVGNQLLERMNLWKQHIPT